MNFAIKRILIPEISEESPPGEARHTYDELSENEQEELLELNQLNSEYKSLCKLDHPLVCELLEVYLDRNFIYFVHPFYTGGNLNDQLLIKNQVKDVEKGSNNLESSEEYSDHDEDS